MAGPWSNRRIDPSLPSHEASPVAAAAPTVAVAAPTPPLKRGRKPREKVLPEQVTGRSYVGLLQGYLGRLRTLYPHPNRVLFYDDVVTVYLLAFFNPVLRSLRCIEDASQLPGVSRFLSVEAVCKSTLSAANALFDPEQLQGLIGDLRGRLPNLGQMGAADSQLAYLLDRVNVADGSMFRLAADVEWAIRSNNQHTKAKAAKAGDGGGSGYVRLNCQFCLKTGCPSGVSINGRDGVGEGTAAAALLPDPKEPKDPKEPGDEQDAGQIHLMDSGVVSFGYLDAILGRGEHFVASLAAGVNFEPEAGAAGGHRPLTDKDRAAGVVSDRVGNLGGSDSRTAPAAKVREVLVAYTARDGTTKTLRLLTDLLDLPAHLIAELYRHRWQIELFFRWLKVNANFRHLTSHSRNGIALSFYVATIACMLMCLQTQKPLSKYGYNLLGMAAAGLGDLHDILPLLENRQRERERDRARQAEKRAARNATKNNA